MGEIVVGGWCETFVCTDPDLDGLESRWREALSALLGSASVAVLPHDAQFAWVIYREGTDCFVQQRLSLTGDFENLSPRVVVTEDGEPVSEWVTSLAAVRQFLAT